MACPVTRLARVCGRMRGEEAGRGRDGVHTCTAGAIASRAGLPFEHMPKRIDTKK